MKKVNNLRATLIYSQYGSGDCSIVVTDVLKRFLKTCLSITENGECDRKGCRSLDHEIVLPVVSIADTIFDNNMANLKTAILNNFPDKSSCKKCRKTLTHFQRDSGYHLFIEVSATK